MGDSLIPQTLPAGLVSPSDTRCWKQVGAKQWTGVVSEGGEV